MASSFTKFYIHGVFAVKYRNAMIDVGWERELFSIVGDALKGLGHLPIKINGDEDHIHALWRHNRTRTISETMKAMKGRSSHWVNDARLTKDLFRWQAGYGAFTVSVDRVPQVKGYIERQKIHHKTETVFEEYEKLLRAHGEKEIHEFMFNFLE